MVKGVDERTQFFIHPLDSPFSVVPSFPQTAYEPTARGRAAQKARAADGGGRRRSRGLGRYEAPVKRARNSAAERRRPPEVAARSGRSGAARERAMGSQAVRNPVPPRSPEALHDHPPPGRAFQGRKRAQRMTAHKGF